MKVLDRKLLSDKSSMHMRAPLDLANDAPIGHLLRRSYQHAMENTADALRPLEITPRQAVALRSIARHQSLSQGEIGKAIGMEPANVHGLVDRLKKKGLIKVETDPRNSKKLKVSLTANGRSVTCEIEACLLRAEAGTLRNLETEDRLQLVRLLHLLLA